jgi:hypothetical protein
MVEYSMSGTLTELQDEPMIDYGTFEGAQLFPVSIMLLCCNQI